MRRIEKVNKFELVRDIKALIALALADELIEGGDARYRPISTVRGCTVTSEIWG
jgi:hypothetical protein